ncbi:bifunctional UDP-N-acetylmuramoyl-tripeptide:D-alanyl-D-alanine ligase/alanine racemase [Polluticoccus soli]|uniref:bifunctional UDP-N-acetylmuramoyl-tripeptide:D-alanyl-D-alanine ligase/alanine racemase n=1 Tax=Polluticoccus soli TaxID=3034150 RepID=UPI0023E2B9F4|nr:bifunctional UDP-N-acetylmuramoyl-tripeptide:D-alanyl-D-alanine ligase/alanine racemase [Flavipsychrobacter sp. JY13-12]
MVTVEQRTDTGQILKWSNGTWLQHNADKAIEELVIDTRKIAQPSQALFIALKSSRRDGHSFIKDAYEKGVRNFLVSVELDTAPFPDANFILVKDTLVALQQLVGARRKQFKIPVIGITGSNGKTIVKEWLYQLLNESYNTVRSPKSYNSQIGVPLSVWLMKPQHKLAIFEAGISQPGEMEHLGGIIRPDIGVFTNIGEAHSEGFLNTRQKINEKLMLFRYASQLVYCKDYPELNECVVQFMHQLKGAGGNHLSLFTWSQKVEADLQIKHIVKDGNKANIEALWKDEQLTITIPFTDPASIENAIHCWCVMLLMGIPHDVISTRMMALHPVSMRLELRQGINDSTIINDSYNSDLTSLLIALDYLEQQKQHRQHTVILSDMLQIARADADLYEEVAEHISRRNIQRFIGIGPSLYKNRLSFKKNKKLRSVFFKSTDDFLKKFHLITFDSEAILLKGARVFTFEKIATLLEQKVHQTVLSINLSSLTHNLNVFRSKLKPGVKTMAMVKAFSYGSGSYEIANLLQYSGVDYLSVAYTDEGVSLRKAGITMPIMVMSPDATSFDRMIAWKLEPEIFSTQSLRAFTAMAQTLQVQGYPVHIKLDTGMHRLGFMAHDIEPLVKELELNPYVKVASIFSHLAASEDPAEDAFTAGQAAAFDQMSKQITDHLPYKPMLHLCNSSGIVRHPALHYDMVRLGLGLYGVESSKTMQKQLRQVSTLKTIIAQIKDIPVGDTVGYGRKAVATSEMRTATISIGYADGYPRSLGNSKAHVLIHGKPAKVIGVVCMDMCMVDITHIPEAREGDEVIVFSPELPITQLAEWAGTIPYELMTGVSQRVKRVYENEI